jgi:hypothetical protein
MHLRVCVCVRECVCMHVYVCIYAGQQVIYFTIKTFGALVYSTIMTVRQFLSLLLSSLLFLNPLSAGQWLGSALVFGALYAKGAQRPRVHPEGGALSSRDTFPRADYASGGRKGAHGHAAPVAAGAGATEQELTATSTPGSKPTTSPV